MDLYLAVERKQVSINKQLKILSRQWQYPLGKDAFDDSALAGFDQGNRLAIDRVG